MRHRLSCVVFVSMSFLLNLSAETARIWAVNAGNATRYGDFAGDTNVVGWYSVTAATNLTELSSPAPAEVYQSLKYHASAFSYTLLPLQPGGRYTLRLHYNEDWNNHQFTVSANGTQIQSAFNPYVAAGNRYKYAVIRDYPVQAASDGKISLAFTGSGGGCVVNGIEIVEEATNNLIRPLAACWPQRVPGASPVTYKTVIGLSWQQQVYGNLPEKVYTVFRSTNDWASFTPVAVLTNLALFTDSDITLGGTNQYFVKRGAFTAAFAGTPQPGECVSVAIPLADNYAIPYRRVWAVNCGYTGTDLYGEFAPDTQYSSAFPNTASTGSAITIPDTLDFPAPMSVYQTVRWSNVAFSYAFPVLTNRPYRVRLHFAEDWGPGREIGLVVNGYTVTNNYNITVAAGGNQIATILEHDCMAGADGQVRVDVTRGNIDNPMVNGIELVEFYYAPPITGELTVAVSNTWEAVAEVRPSRVCNTAAYSGTVWRAESPDGVYTSVGSIPFNGSVWGDTPETGLATNKIYRYVVRAGSVTPETNTPGAELARFIPNRYSVWMGSGNLIHFVPPTGFSRTNSTTYNVSTIIDRSTVSGAGPLAVYQQQRYNNPLSFLFTALHAGANYRLRLHFAETYYSDPGVRQISIAVNGQTVNANFDAGRAAGGVNRAIAPEFTVTADAQGQLAVLLKWVTQNPLLAALEVRAVPLAAAPSALTAVPGSAKVALSWPPVVGAGGYAVYRTASGGEPQEIGRVAGTTFTDATGVIGTTYTYAVRAYNEFGEGPAVTAAAMRYPARKGTLIYVF